MTSSNYNPCVNCIYSSSCSHIKHNDPVCPERARYDRLAAIEDILGDEYELDRLRELAPVRHAKWKYFHKQNKAVCTSCSFERDLDADFGRAIACPNCAARMDSDFYDSRRFLFLRPAKD